MVSSLARAVEPIGSKASLMIGGFGGAGAPIELIHALIDRYVSTGTPKELTVINNNAGNGSIGLAALIEQGMVAKLICSFPRSVEPKAFTERYKAGAIKLELVPQGTLAERIRSGGAGIPAFYTKTGVGTPLAQGKASANFEGKEYIQERWLKADYALIKVDVADRMGNCTYRMTARNFNPLMAMASRVTIAQARDVVDAGTINPEHIVTPGVFVDHVCEVAHPAQEEDLFRSGVKFP